MDVNTLTTLINTVAFPILACVAMGWYINTIMEKVRNSVDKCTSAVLVLTERLAHYGSGRFEQENQIGKFDNQSDA